MEKSVEKLITDVFNSPKKTLRLLDRSLKKDDISFSISSLEKGSYTLIDDEKQELCSTNSVYNCLVGLLYFNYGYGKDDTPRWALFSGEEENNFENILRKIDNSSNSFISLQTAINNGGIFGYNSSTNKISFTLPSELNYSQDIAFKCPSFSSGIEQMEGVLSTLNFDNLSSEMEQ